AEFKLGCRLFIINFPHNPTGATLTKFDLKRIVVLCKKYNVWLLSDEVFRGLEHNVEQQLPAVADLYVKGISIGVISKAFAIPGIRVGWLVCKSKWLRTKVSDIKGYLSICNSQVDELLAATILKHKQKLLKRNLQLILKNKKLLMNVKSISGVDVDIVIPNTGCCIFAILNGNGAVIDSDILVKDIARVSNYLLYPSGLFKTDVNAIRIGFGGSRFSEFVSVLS
ncbi:MAG: pyridoxal phosphate-dependent aminotransferase, partial [Alcanivoracaceae bacterium]|nr:pyridoxal phosphate-dependent aminotransferase [Alcanivoracaceae bacterium]